MIMLASLEPKNGSRGWRFEGLDASVHLEDVDDFSADRTRLAKMNPDRSKGSVRSDPARTICGMWITSDADVKALELDHKDLETWQQIDWQKGQSVVGLHGGQ